MRMGKSTPDGKTVQEAQRISEKQSLADEEVGVAHRIDRFYLPFLMRFCAVRGKAPDQVHVLDCGCGNASSLRLLAEAGFNAYGVDLAELRIKQWVEKDLPRTAWPCQADATRLPFSDKAFDIVLSCGLIEHIGVSEECTPEYHVCPAPGQMQARMQFIAECLRVLRPDGEFYLDHPNGAFFIDFWHNDYRSRPRFHAPYEKFLPSFGEIRKILKSIAPRSSMQALSPAGRFTYRRSDRRWYGKLFSSFMEHFFKLIRHRPFSALAGSPLNPYLVIRITRNSRDQR